MFLKLNEIYNASDKHTIFLHFYIYRVIINEISFFFTFHRMLASFVHQGVLAISVDNIILLSYLRAPK